MDSDFGDQIIIQDKDGKDNIIFIGLKAYKIINGKKVLWDIKHNKPMKEEVDDSILK